MPSRLESRRSKRASDDGTVEFAALPLDLTDEDERAYAKATMAASKRTAKTAWKWFDKIGEVQFAVTRNARIAGYAELAAYKLNDDGTIGEKITGNKAAAKVARGIYSRFGGQRALIERFMLMAKVPGDTYLIRTHDANKTADGYDWCSADELDMTEVEVKDAPNTTRVVKRKTLPAIPASSLGGEGNKALLEDIPLEDFLGRVWRPGGQFMHMPDSPLYALEDVCEILYLLTKSLKGKLRQRLAMNPILYVPQEANKVRSAASKAATGKLHPNELVDEFLKASTFAMTNLDEPESALPTFVVGPGEQSKNLAFIEPERKILETEIKLRAELIDRLLFGLDINPESVKGAGEANHWGAWAASDDERRVAVQPDLEMMCWALTRLVLWPELKAANVPAGQILNTVIWYDLSKATAKSNLAEDARQTFDRGGIDSPALRRLSGIPETDAPDDEERVRMLGWEIGDPYLANFGKDEIIDKIDWDKVGLGRRSGPKADSTADRPDSGPGKGDPGSPNPKDRRNNGPKSSRPA